MTSQRPSIQFPHARKGGPQTVSFGCDAVESTRNGRDARLALLRDCTKIAEWDAVATPRGVDFDPTHDAPSRDDEDPSEIQRVNDRRDRLAQGSRLRSHLDDLWTRGRAETARIEAEWLARPRASRHDVDLELQATAHRGADEQRVRDQRWLDLLWVIARCVCLAPSCLVPLAWRISGTLDRPRRARIERPWVPPVHTVTLAGGPAPSHLERAAAVIEWLVPRARVMLDSVNGEDAIPINRSVTAAVARAFTSAPQWMRWHPPPPPDDAKREIRQAYRVAADAGKAGVQRHGEGLLALAERAWFGTPA